MEDREGMLGRRCTVTGAWIALAYRALQRLNRWCVRAAGAGILAITAFTLYGVFTRYVLRDPDIWSYPVSSYLLLFVTFLATAHAYENGDHVQVDIVVQRMPARVRRALGAIADLATLVFLAVFLVQIWRMFWFSVRTGRTDETMLAWPLAAVQWVMPLGAAMLLLTHVGKMLHAYLGPPADAGGRDP